MRRETASAYLKAAGVGVRPPGAWGRRAPAKPANEVTTGSDAGQVERTANPSPNPNPENLSTKGKVKTKAKAKGAKPANEVTTGFGVELEAENPKRSVCEPFREAIELGLSRGRDATAIWQDLVAENGFDGGYQTVKRYVRKLRGKQPLQPRAVILTGPGEESQVDYGTGAMVRDPQTRKYRRTRLFVMVLGCSRKAARFLTFRSSSRIWAELHEKAFRRLGGATRVVVLDNLREGVLVPDIYDPTLNPLYRDVLAHYGAVALPCRIKDPDRKGKVESGVGHAQRALQGKRFESLEEAQAYLDRWEPSCADTRIHGTTKRQVAAMFAEEKPSLLPLPLEPFRYYQHGQRGVNLDGCVEVDAAYYGLPPGWIGREVKVQWDELYVRILDPKNGLLLREHVRQKRGWYRIQKEDRPQHMPLQVSQLLWRAGRAGSHIGTLCHLIYSQLGEVGIRRILGVLSLAKRLRMPARLLLKWECMSTASFVAISNVPHNLPCGKSTLSFANWFTTAISSTSEPRSKKMNLIELNRALGQLRLGGIAAVLETRLRQAQAEAMPPIDFLSCLVSDELTRRGERLLERRKKQAEFRDPQKTLDNFDFNFNRKMNRSLVFDLATGAFIARHEDGLFLGPPGTGKSHLAQAIGQAAIQQGYRVLYRETHKLLDDLAEATIDGTRRECMELFVSLPLLIIDDLGMRKLPMTAAEDLLEIVMRRYERASTLLTSNRPVDDWGKLLGDSAAVTAMLDRLLHHGHVLKCGPRSWRTKTDLPPQEATE